MREGLLGWATEMLIELDDKAPGVLSRVLTAAPARRQAIFFALAAHEQNCGRNFSGGLIPPKLAEVVRHGRAADILRHALGDVPNGLRRLLERAGDRPLPRSKDYILLHDLAASGDRRGVDALVGAGRISVRKLEVLASLDPRWRHANTVGRIDTCAEATTFNAALTFVQSLNSRATDEVVANAIASMRPTSTLARLLDRFMRRADRLPPHPVPLGDNELRPLASVRDLMEAGRRYRNCLSHRIADVAAGRMAVAEFRGELLMEFRPLSLGAGWALREVHGMRNGPVPLTLAEAAEAKCDQIGIPRFHEEIGGDGWKSYRRFTGELEWG
ncbi:hypothetical protein ACFPIF_14710 [Brevundimonas faecalis]|uniref:hypothetical protein n=1 Tax=Brevundimonas faecalis TaxID=947378 RepID=UPI003606E6E5